MIKNIAISVIIVASNMLTYKLTSLLVNDSIDDYQTQYTRCVDSSEKLNEMYQKNILELDRYRSLIVREKQATQQYIIKYQQCAWEQEAKRRK